MDNSKLQVVTFKATPEQIERLRKMSKATGKRTSTLMRDIVDSALLIERPLVASNYKGGPVHHGGIEKQTPGGNRASAAGYGTQTAFSNICVAGQATTYLRKANPER